MKRLILVLLASTLAGVTAHAQMTPFNGDSAYAVLNSIVNGIGPRPMGSPAERAALAFAAAKFKSYGCQDAYVMPMTVAGGVNTNSGVAVGILKGRSDSIIVIGGHMDSEGPEIPGANDDGSGAAIVIELARVLSQRQNNSTIVFCCWGGEEEGLRGSEYFVANFPRLKDVVLMLQIDMADGSGDLEADPDGEYQTSAPRWLVKAAFDLFYDDLKYDGLIYPTQAATLNSSTRGSTGSDHSSFLMKGIPAIDFTSDVTYPIHTPLDNWQNFNRSGLTRSGDLVYKLAERFDAGVPSRETEEYWLVAYGKTLFFFSHPVLRVIAMLAVILAVVALVDLRRRRIPAEPRTGASALKLILFTLLIQSCIWLSETVVGFLKDYRYPWVNNFGGFVALGILSGLLGLWLSLVYARRYHLSQGAYGYYLWAIIMLLALTLLMSYANAELGVYPAISLLLLALATLVRSPFVKAVCALLMPVPMIRLVFMEYIGLVQRLLTQVQRDSLMSSAIYNLGFIILFSILSLPFVFALASIYRSSGVDLFWFKRFGGKISLVGVTSGIVIMTTYLLFQPVYDRMWQPSVRLQQAFTLDADSGVITIGSGEYLRGIRVTCDGRDTTLDGRFTSMTLKTMHPAVVRWLAVNDTVAPAVQEDSLKSFTRTLTLRSLLRPFTVNVNYRSPLPFRMSSNWATGGRLKRARETDRAKTLTWYSFPDSILVIPVTFALRDTQKVSETIEVTYDTLAYPVTVGRDLTMFKRRTVVSAGHTFGVPANAH